MCLQPKFTELDQACIALALTAHNPWCTIALAILVKELADRELLDAFSHTAQTAAAPAPHGNIGRSITDRKGNVHRDRTEAQQRLHNYSDREFVRRFKVSKQRFWKLVDLLRPHVEPDDLGKQMAEVSSGGFVPAECQLAATLRYLSGACKMDQEDLFGIAHTTFYASLWKVIYALDAILTKSFDPYDVEELTRLAADMYDRSGRTVKGCIGALDGMALEIKKPVKMDEENRSNYMNRKGFYSFNLQAIADARRRIIYYSLATQGSTHDSLAFKLSSLGKQLDNKGLPEGFWIVGDEAYVCGLWLLSPFGASQARENTYKDNFNFYLSRCRINVECAFGILVWRFGILRRPILCSLEHASKLVAVCIALHNLAIEDGIGLFKPLDKDFGSKDSLKPIAQDKVTYAERGLMRKGVGDKRDAITAELKELGYMRPAHRRQRR